MKLEKMVKNYGIYKVLYGTFFLPKNIFYANIYYKFLRGFIMNSKLRKKVSLLVSLSMIFTIFSACSKTTNSYNLKDATLYDEATTLVSEYYDDLELENSLQCFYVYNYLANNGYLSLDSNSNYKYKDMYNNNMLGVDVLYTSDTTCRHLSEYYMNTLNKSGYEAYCMVGMLNNDDRINHQLVIVNDEYTTYQDNYNKAVFEKSDGQLQDLFGNEYMVPYAKPVTNKKLISTHNSMDVQRKINKMYEDDNDKVTQDYVSKQYDIAYHKMMVVYPEKLQDFKEEYNKKVLNKMK